MQTQSASILIVEDDPGLLQLLGEYLGAAGFDIHLEDDGARTLGRIRDLNPDVVVLDLMLPGLDGLEICRRARDDFDGGILMLTASRTEADQMLGLG
ncbi:MAG: response regulator, partial [Myxococcota bacterium]